MERGNKVRLNCNIDNFKMFTRKGEDAQENVICSGTEGLVEEVYTSGNGIVNFDGHRILMTKLSDKVSCV